MYCNELARTYGGCLYDGDSLNDLTLVHLRARSFEIADNGGHTSLISEGSGEMDGFLLVILGEGLHEIVSNW